MLVYKQYDQAALDRQYNNRLQVPDFARHLDRWESLSRQTEKEFSSIRDISYGKLLREKLDIYPSPQPLSKTLIFIHGGYWHKSGKEDVQFIAKAFRAYNITIVLINYPLAPAVSIDQLSTSCREAVNWVYKNISAFNGDPDQLYVAGHSAGGHLAAMLLTTAPITPASYLPAGGHGREGEDRFDLAPDVIKGVCTISGLFNLIPIYLSDINQALNMDKATALRNSPVNLLPATQCPLAITVGRNETDEFLDQSNELYARWKESIPVKMLQIEGLNHYSILETMLDPVSSLHKVVRGVMKI
ncbi:MAG: alpha/beta hydrolase [Chitinophagales bacterium]